MILDDIYGVILERRRNPSPDSYVSALTTKGKDAILKKIGEEAAEVIIASKGLDKQQVIHEMADLWFHCMVLMAEEGLSHSDILKELEDRFNKKKEQDTSGCIFCNIISKETPAGIIYEDENVMALEDINPQAPLHVLVIPKKHIPTSLGLTNRDNELIGQLFQAANKIATERGVAERGFRLVMNTNPEAGQSVYHIHLHLLGGRPMHWPPG